MGLAAAIVTLGIGAIGAVVSLIIVLSYKPPASTQLKPKQLDFDFDSDTGKRA